MKFYTPFFYYLLLKAITSCLNHCMCVCVVGCWCTWAHIMNWVLTCYYSWFLHNAYSKGTGEVLYSQTFCIIIVKKWFYSMASVPFTCPIGCIHLLAFNCVWCLLWRCMYTLHKTIAMVLFDLNLMAFLHPWHERCMEDVPGSWRVRK